MKKLVIVSLSAGILILGAVIVNAQTTFQGPPSGCTNPTQTGCNLDGVIWNRAITAPQAQSASFYITGNTRTGGSARVGNGLTVDTGGANITGLVRIINADETIQNGDLYLTSGRAIRIDQSSGASTFNIGNWGAANLPVNVNILGTLNVVGNGTWDQAKITSREYCIGTSCITAWPTGGSGGSVTSVGSGNGLTGGPITSSGTLNVGAGTGISVGTDDVGLDLTYTDGRYFVRDNQLDNNAGIYSRTGRIGAMDNSGSNSNYPYVNIGGGMIGYYENLGFWSVSPQTVFRNSVSMLGGSVSIGQLGGHTLQITGIVSGNTRYNVGGNNSSICVSSGGTTCSSWSPTLGAVRGDQLCIGTDCRNAWPSAGGTGDLTDVLATANSGIIVNNSGGPQPSVGLLNTCAAGQVLKWNGSAWGCAPDNDSLGDITGVTANTPLTGGGASGAVSLGLMNCSSAGQVLKWNGTAWACAADTDTNSGGDITGVTANSPLTGGGASGAVSLGLMNCAVTGQYLRWNGTGWECWTVNPGAGLGQSMGNYFIQSSYQMPQTCTTGQVVQKTSGGWGCLSAAGDITGLIAGTAISITDPGGPEPWISVNLASLDTRYAIDSTLNARYVTKTGNSSITGDLSVSGDISIGGTGAALYVNSQEALWYNGTYFSWGYGGSANYFADNVGIGVTNPTYQLHLSLNSAAKPTSNVWTISSDIRLKDVHGDFTKGLDEITKLNPIYYTYKKDNPYNYPSDTIGVGFSAQEVEKYIPEAVKTDSNGYLQIEADSIYWAMLNSIKELKSQNDELREQNQDLEKRLQRLEALMSTILQ